VRALADLPVPLRVIGTVLWRVGAIHSAMDVVHAWYR